MENKNILSVNQDENSYSFLTIYIEKCQNSILNYFSCLSKKEIENQISKTTFKLSYLDFLIDNSNR